MKQLYPDKYVRESVIKGAKISTCLREYHEDKNRDTKKRLDIAIEDAKQHLNQKEKGNE